MAKSKKNKIQEVHQPNSATKKDPYQTYFLNHEYER